MPEFRFKTNAKVERLVGRELITNNTVAIFELVKNSYDAGAKSVEIKFGNFLYHDNNRSKVVSTDNSFIEVSDNGKGMSPEEIETYWMELGTPNKELNRHQEVRLRKQQIDIVVKRTVNGEKGIGRFGVDKIGSYLNMESIDKNLKSKTIVNFDWSEFDNSDKLIEHIPCEYIILPVEKNDTSGLKLKIMNLRDKWTWKDVDELKKSLRKFLSPIIIQQDEFRIFFTFPEKQMGKIIQTTEEVINDSFEYLKTSISAKMYKTGAVSYEIIDRGRVVEKEEIKFWEYSSIGEVEVKIFYLDPDDKRAFTKNMGLRTSDYGNIKIFKDNFRVMPYGESHNDWLKIDKEHAQGFLRTFGTRDLVGYVLLSHDLAKGNQALREATDRVGLIEDVEEFDDLKKFVWKAIKVLQIYIFERLDKQSKEAAQILKRESGSLKYETNNLITSVKDIIKKIALPKEQKQHILNELENNSAALMKKIETVETASKEIERKINVYSQITSKEGLLYDMLHTVKNKLAVIQAKIDEFRMEVKDSKINKSIDGLDIAFRVIQKMVEGALDKVNSSKLRKNVVQLDEVLNIVSNDYLPRFRQERIEVIQEYTTAGVLVRCSIDSIKSNVFENLFDNSVKALEKTEEKKLLIKTKINNGFAEIFVSDNGCGIPKDKIPFIFSLWSSNTLGTGIGLATARDTMKDHEGEIAYVDIGDEGLSTTFLIRLPQVG